MDCATKETSIVTRPNVSCTYAVLLSSATSFPSLRLTFFNASYKSFSRHDIYGFIYHWHFGKFSIHIEQLATYLHVTDEV